MRMPSAATNKLEKQTSIGSGMQNRSSGGGAAPTAATQNADSPTATEGSNNNVINNTENNANNAINNTKGSVAGTMASDGNNPVKQVLVTIEHKIRNLEKRKTKLESYRAIQATGKELSADQKAAVAKYDEVTATLEFARDLAKQILQLSKDAEKEQKKQARKDIVARAHAETAKIREVLVIQNILVCMSDDSIRSDLTNGEHGAPKLETTDIEALEKFNNDILTRRPETIDDNSFVNTAQKAAEYFSLTIDGRPKQYSDVITFEHLRRVFNQIQESGYLDKVYMRTPEVITEEKDSEAVDADVEEVITGVGDENSQDDIDNLSTVANGSNANDANEQMTGDQQQPVELMQQPTLKQQPLKEHVELQQITVAAGVQAPPTAVPTYQTTPQQPPSGTTTPVHLAMFSAGQPMQPPPQLQAVPPTGGIISVAQGPPPPQMVVAQPPPQQQRQVIINAAPSTGGQQLPPAMHGGPPPSHFAATTVRAVEQTFFKQHQQQQQQFIQQQMRPLSEVLGSGSFHFLQDSELDSPEIGGGNSSLPVSGVVFEQQQQPSQANLVNHADLTLATTEMHKTQQQLLATGSIPRQSQQPQPLQQQQAIPTQTFTNQSFPPIPQVQSPALAAATVAAANSNTPTLTSSTPSPLFQQKHPQLFSPQQQLQEGQQQMLMNEQHQPMVMIMTRLAAPQTRLPPQTSQQQQQQHDVSSGTGFSFENSVVGSALNYEQHLPQEIATATTLKAANTPGEEEKNLAIDETVPSHKFSEKVGEWDNDLNSTPTLGQTSNTAATAVLSNALKSNNDVANNWSTEIDATSSGNTVNIRKNEWSSSTSGSTGGSGSNGGGYGDGSTTQSSINAHDSSNHWNTSQRQEDGGVHFSNNRYPRRRGGRSNNYGNSSQSQNGGGGRGNSGIYFRNNDNSSGSGSYYQNGSGSSNVYSNNKDLGSRYESGSGNYRGPRGNTNNSRGNAPPSARSIGRNNSGGGSGGNSNSSGGPMNSSSSNTSNTYMRNRIALGLDK